VSKVTLTLPEALKRAFTAYSEGKLSEAERLCQAVVAVKHDVFDALHMLAVVQSKLGRKDEALASFDRALVVEPNHAEALCNRGVILHALQQFAYALESFDGALTARPDYAEAHFRRGNTSFEMKRFEEALLSYERALAGRPDHIDALFGRALTLHELQRFEAALSSYQKVLLARPEYAEAINICGLALHALRRFDEAIASYERALKIKPSYVDAHYNKGLSLQELKRFEEALASYDQALAIQPQHADALNCRGNTLRELRRFEEAILSYEQALAVRPNYAEVHYNRGSILYDLMRLADALSSFDRALALKPDYAEALLNRGNVFSQLKQYDKAFASYDQALTVEANLKFVPGMRLNMKMLLCDWSNFDNEYARLISDVQRGHPVSVPFVVLTIPSSVSDQLECAQIAANDKFLVPAERIWRGERYAHDRIRIAYISADFCDHPVAHLLAELFERHDRARFETIAISLGLDDGSEMRTRLKGVFERFIDVRNKSDAEVAGLMRELEVDIAVDLMGFTFGCRPAILAFRAAPIQVNYLSYPGIVGTDFIDYILADRFVIPEEQRGLFSEPVVYLPDTYLAYDSTRKISERIPTRAELGLPASGFVFCAYNNSYKIRPAIFDIWMRLLREVEGSVLLLTSTSAATETNLRREAAARGIDPSRLIFAAYMPRVDDHLARYRAADLFLDTLPFNAQTTACDALWAGLPVVTRLGETFVGRVAGSVLSAVGLPELITHSAEDYEALALKLARDPDLLAQIKAKLARNRASCPLFNSERFTRHFEAACTTMWETWQRGEAPKSFSVEPYKVS
jgi:predicted O-linked N-acetylglucosamine transferase (SPINDLY family)